MSKMTTMMAAVACVATMAGPASVNDVTLTSAQGGRGLRTQER